MTKYRGIDRPQTARLIGAAWLGSVIIGLLTAIFIAPGIDINLSADVAATADEMLGAEQRVRAKAYIALLLFGLKALSLMGLFYLLRGAGPLMAGWSVLIGLGAAALGLLGAVFGLNVAEIGSDAAYQSLASAPERTLLAGLQATSDYTSFHLSLVLGSIAKAGFFILFLRSRDLPKLIAAWGLFASLFVAIAIVARDFIPALGHGGVTAAFMLSNLVAIIATGLYLLIKGTPSVSD